MSLEAAIGRIDQIVQLREQLFDPTAGTGSSTAAGASTGGAAISPTASAGAGNVSSSTTGSSTSADQADFATALAAAQSASAGAALTDPTNPGSSVAASTSTDPLGAGLLDALGSSSLGSTGSLVAANDLASAAATGGSGAADATGASASATPAAVQSMVEEANALVGKPYVWGGGHSDWGPSTGYDCSGFVSAVLHAGGYLSSPQDTQTLPSSPGIESGPGQYVTIYDRTDAGTNSDHVIIDLGGQFYEAGGEAGSWGGGGGVEQISTPSAAYLASFNQILHPAGL